MPSTAQTPAHLSVMFDRRLAQKVAPNTSAQMANGGLLNGTNRLSRVRQSDLDAGGGLPQVRRTYRRRRHHRSKTNSESECRRLVRPIPRWHWRELFLSWTTCKRRSVPAVLLDPHPHICRPSPRGLHPVDRRQAFYKYVLRIDGFLNMDNAYSISGADRRLTGRILRRQPWHDDLRALEQR